MARRGRCGEEEPLPMGLGPGLCAQRRRCGRGGSGLTAGENGASRGRDWRRGDWVGKLGGGWKSVRGVCAQRRRCACGDGPASVPWTLAWQGQCISLWRTRRHRPRRGEVCGTGSMPRSLGPPANGCSFKVAVVLVATGQMSSDSRMTCSPFATLDEQSSNRSVVALTRVGGRCRSAH